MDVVESRDKKVSIWGRLSGWLDPLLPEEVQLYNAELAMARQYERLLRAEAEKVEAEVAHQKAQTALVEEENARERAKIQGHNIMGSAEFHASAEGGKVDIVITVLFEENSLGHRKRSFRVKKSQGGGAYKLEDQAIGNYLGSLKSYMLYVEPWLRGQVPTKHLGRMRDARDDQLISVDLVNSG